MTARSFILFIALLALVFALSLPSILACIRINGVTGDWQVVQPNQILNLGDVGKGSVLYFYVDVKERNGCPPWDNWDRMWAKELPHGILENYTGWFEIYFHPFTLIITNSTQPGEYIIPLCVQDQGTGKVECFKVRFRVTEPDPRLNYSISRDFNTIILTIKNIGNVWQVCNVSTNLPAIISKKTFYLPANGYSGNLYIYPEKEGLLRINITCTVSKLSIEYNYQRKLVDANVKLLELYPGEHAYILLRKLPGVSLDISTNELGTVLDYPKLEIFVPKDIKPGNYTINITATLDGRKQNLVIVVRVKSNWPLICPFINLYVFNTSVKSSDLRPVVIPVLFWNQDSSNHTVPLSVETSSQELIVKYPENVFLPANRKVIYNITVASLGYGNYTLVIKVPPCHVEKVIHVTFAKPVQQKIIYPLANIKDPILQIVPSEVNIYPTSGYLNVTVTVINPNNIVCSCNLNGKTFALAKEYSDVLSVNVSRFFLAGTYQYPVTLYCTCKNKTIVKTAELTIHVRPYHRVIIEPSSVKLNASQGSFALKIKNLGNVPEQVSLGSLCGQALYIQTPNFTLEPRVTKTIVIRYNFTSTEPKSCAIIVSGSFGEQLVPVSFSGSSSSQTTQASSGKSLTPGIGLPVFMPFYYLFKFI